MRRIRTGLLALPLSVALAAPVMAQVAPNVSGQSGLIQLTNADLVPAGRFALGFTFNSNVLVAHPSLAHTANVDDPMRYRFSTLGLSVGFGMTDWLEASVKIGQGQYNASERAWAGVIGGHDRYGRVKHTESDKLRIGVKALINGDDPVKIALFGAYYASLQSKNDLAALTSNRADWEFGTSLNYGIFTTQVSYLTVGDYRTPTPFYGTIDPGFDIPNQLTWGFGVNIPLIPTKLAGIAEINRIHFDGGDTRAIDYSEIALGARFGIGGSGLSATAALRTNIDSWIKYQSNIGGMVQIGYVPKQRADGPVQKLQRAQTDPEPAPAPAPTAPATEPAQPMSAPISEPQVKTETSTTDEILFDGAKSRLTNIAKAILDGVALRLKNNLSATCAVVGYTDPKEKGGEHTALAKARAESTKDYLVKRHGIDASRIKTEVMGDAEAGADSTRNRRVVVTVKFP